jgi:hypothetical protein
MRKLLVSTALAGVVVALATGPASADSSVVAVPGHVTTAGLTLLGASAAGVVVQQDALPQSQQSPGVPSVPHVFSGAEGTQLGRRTAMELTAEDRNFNRGPAAVVAVSGDTVAWDKSARIGGCNCNWQAVHRMNVRTGADVADGEMPPPLAFSASSWFSDQIGSFSQFPFPPASLKRYTPSADQTFLPSTVIAPDSGNSVALDVDGNTGLLATFALSDPNNGDSRRIYRLDLVNLTSGAVTPVVEGTDVISRVALSDTRIVWAAQASGAPVTINQRARSGGATTSYVATEGVAGGTKLVLAQGKVGYLAPTSGDPLLRVVSGATARTVALPAGSSGLATDGTRFLTAAGGDPSVAGVYGVPATGTAGATRVATLPPTTFDLSNVTLSGGLLHYTDDSLRDRPGRPLWMRSVSGNNHPSLGPETLMHLPTGSGTATYAGPFTSFSDGRAAVSGTDGGGAIRLFDRDETTGIITGTSAGAPKVSGPYTMLGADVYLADGEHLYSAPSLLGSYLTGDLYGSVVALVLQDPDTQALKIYEDDAAATNPRLLASIPAPEGDGGCMSPKVGAWGEKVAWTSCDGQSLTVENWITKDTRTVPGAATAQDPIQQLALGEGTLGWSTNQGVHLLDLTAPGSHALTLPGTFRSFALDDHRIALTTTAGTALVEQLPLGNLQYRPRLIGSYARHAFTPGPGKGGTWRPQFDVSKPLRGVELTITTDAGRKVTTLDGTAPDGSIRDLGWDGKDRKGAAVPSGIYTWTLTGRADDGDGQLMNQTGDSPTVSGQIEVDAAN